LGEQNKSPYEENQGLIYKNHGDDSKVYLPFWKRSLPHLRRGTVALRPKITLGLPLSAGKSYNIDC